MMMAAGTVVALKGLLMMYRGLRGYQTSHLGAGADSTQRSPIDANSITVEKAIVVERPRKELYEYWRNVENLARFMDNILSVQKIDENRSHWVAKAPAGTVVEWDAVVVNEKPYDLIAWQSLQGSDVPNAGTVRFERGEMDERTIVRVWLKYQPPAGLLGKTLAKVFGEDPQRQVEEDLERFKRIMESDQTVPGISAL
jgi:uncharacterized membrane protein